VLLDRVRCIDCTQKNKNRLCQHCVNAIFVPVHMIVLCVHMCTAKDTESDREEKGEQNQQNNKDRAYHRTSGTHYIAFQHAYLASANPLSTHAYLSTNREYFSSKVSATIIDEPPYISPQQFFDEKFPSAEEAEILEKREKKALKTINNYITTRMPKTCVVIFESVLGAAGVWMFPKSFVNNLRILCDKNEIIIVCDEVLTGMGRTGKYTYLLTAHANVNFRKR
jgi:hypothetical protein